MRNVEIKAKIRELAALIQKAKALSKSEGEVIKQHDTFYNSINGRLKLREYENGDGDLIYYDRPDEEGPKLSSFEIARIQSDHVGNLNKVLELALGAKGVVKKTRYLFMVDQTRIHVDSVTNLGDFMELEVCLRPEQSVEEGQKIAESLMKDLGVEHEDLISGAYADLLLKKN